MFFFILLYVVFYSNFNFLIVISYLFYSCQAIVVLSKAVLILSLFRLFHIFIQYLQIHSINYSNDLAVPYQPWFKVKAHCNIKQYEQAVLYTSTPTCATLIRYINHRAKHPLDFMHIDAFVCLLSWFRHFHRRMTDHPVE